SVIFLIGIMLIVAGAGFGLWAYTQSYRPTPIPEEALSATTVTPSTTSSTTSTTVRERQTTHPSTSSTTTTTEPIEVYGKPVHITIEKIDVNDELVPIGLGPNGEFEAEPFTVAWYNGSVWPGQSGPMLIGAHVSWRSKGPDRFARLSEL